MISSKKNNNIEGSILLLDKDGENLKSLSEFIIKLGYNIHYSSILNVSPESISDKRPDLILMDVNENKLRTCELCNQIKLNKNTKDIPVVFLGVRNTLTEKKEAYKSGCNDLITKPYNYEEVHHKINSYVNLKEFPKQLEQQLIEKNKTLKLINNKLKESEEKFHLVFDQIPYILEIFTPDGTTVMVNEQWEKTYMAKKETVIGKFNLLKDQQIKELGLLPLLTKAFEGEMVTMPDNEFDPIKSKQTGRNRWLRTKVIPIKDNKEKVKLVVIMHEDITEKKQAENKLIQKERYYRSLLYNMHEDIIVIDRNYKITDVNNNFLITTHHSKEQVIGKNCFEISHNYNQPCDKKGEDCKLKEVLKTGEFQSCYHVHKTAEGPDTHLDILLSPLKDEKGNITHVIETMRDITNIKIIENSLRESEQKFRNLVESSSDWIWEFDERGICTYSSPKIESIMGYKPHEMQGKTPFDYMEPKEAARVKEILQNAILNKKPITHLETKNIHKKGYVVMLESNAVPFFDDQGNIKGYRGINRDITERKKSEERLKRSEAEMKSIFRAVPVGIGVVVNRVFVNVNERICELTGYSKDELISRSARMIYPSREEFEKVGKEKNKQIKQDHTGSIETQWMRKDGQIIDISLSSWPIDTNDYSKGVTFSALDITKQNQAKKERDSYLYFLKNITQINEIIQKSNNIDQLLWDVLKAALSIFKCDRIWLLYPLEITATSLEAVIEVTNKKYPGAFSRKSDIPMDSSMAETGKILLNSDYPVAFGRTEKYKIPPQSEKEYNVLSLLAMALFPKTGSPWTLGMHQCSYNRKWTKDEISLFNEIGRRIEDSISLLLLFKNLQKSEKEHRTFIENSVLGIYRTTPDGKVLLANQALLNMLDYSSLDDFQKINLEKDIDNKLYPRSIFKKEIKEKGIVTGFETRFIKKDGTVVDISESAQIVKNNSGDILYYEGWVEDITLRKQAEKRIQESERKFRNLFDSSSDGIIITNKEFLIVSVNETLLNLLDYKKEQLIGKKVVDFILPKYVNLIKSRIKQLFANKILSPIEIEVYLSSGNIIPLELNSKLVDYENQKVVLTIIRDISDRKETERKVLNAVIETEEKEKERFAKDLHDGIGPLLSATKIYSKSLQIAENEEERMQTIKRLEETIDDAIQSVQEISNNLSPHVLKNFGLTAAIESFYKKISDVGQVKIAFGSNFESRVDEKIETTLYRIAVELINNTIKHANAQTIILKLIYEKNSLILNYADDGIGFDVEKTLNKNKGMGLSNILSRVKSLNGDITMNSTTNNGFQVKIRINF